MAGGVILLLAAGLSTASVLRRWLTSQSIPGDFELISIGSGLGAFGFLAYGTLARSNILVDTATTWLPRRVNRAIDGFWTLIWAVVLLVLAERMAQGALETLRSGTTTMVLGLSTWWAIGIGAACLGATALVALRWVGWLWRGQG
ncbi:TRAP transporter small permease subunit [Roseomonas marmotae]|uniref:TRAP transporter small permease protein n=2 Tax=Roseomonas marmotae TaxID=2768161 RepID=A0ABS3KFN3_9PROT|nr:TRAP transporter small permease subunit [Roseomonas marmotae]MBO1076285.1 TRAP transporter small permease subunit [Roseomonas marmotae]QTI80898.1 TRAP transporter small permease subunit [Roseomonas marmotae]